MRLRWGTATISTAIAAWFSECSSFGDAPDSAPPTPSPSQDGGLNESGSDGVDGNAPNETCPPDALACHFFDGALADGTWASTGTAKGSGLLTLQQGQGRTFARAALTTPPVTAGPYVDRLEVVIARQSAASIDLDFRVNDVPLDQRFELATIVWRVTDAEYHFLHLTITAGGAEIAEYAWPSASYFVSAESKGLSPGWHHAKLSVAYEVKTARLDVDGDPPIARALAFLPTAPAVRLELAVGFNYAAEYRGPLSVDLDSVVVRGTL
jgi:hypothetical protein